MEVKVGNVSHADDHGVRLEESRSKPEEELPTATSPAEAATFPAETATSSAAGLAALQSEFRARLGELEQSLRAEFNSKLQGMHGIGPVAKDGLAGGMSTPAQSA